VFDDGDCDGCNEQLSGGYLAADYRNQPSVAATVNVEYRPAITVGGGAPPYQWRITSGSLPAGLSFDDVSGTIVGVPEVDFCVLTSRPTIGAGVVLDATENAGLNHLSTWRGEIQLTTQSVAWNIGAFIVLQ
jgi:hypothetical protein